MIIVSQSQKQELLLTVLLPSIASFLVGLSFEELVRMGLLSPWGVQVMGRLPTHEAGLTVASVVLVLLAWLQFIRSFRLRYAILGAATVSFGLVGPSGVGIMLDSPAGSVDITGFVLLLPPVAGLAICLTILVHYVRGLLQGPVIEWNETMCRECGYLLIGNTSGRCPECGTPIKAGR